MKKLNIVFIGGLSNGSIVCRYLKNNKYVNLGLVITYDDFQKSTRADFPQKDWIIRTSNANVYLDRIRQVKPDFIFVAGWSELLSEELINTPNKGTIGFHPSKLPYDKGRSVLAWQILEGYRETALTMFYYSLIPDGGDIIGQEKVIIQDNDYISDILYKMDEATINLMRAYFPLLRQNLAPRIKQPRDQGNFRRLRTKNDSVINWDTNAKDVYNKIRAIASPYPCARATINDDEYKIESAEVVEFFPFGIEEKCGTLIANLFDGSFIVKCRDHFIRLIKFERI